MSLSIPLYVSTHLPISNAFIFVSIPVSLSNTNPYIYIYIHIHTHTFACIRNWHTCTKTDIYTLYAHVCINKCRWMHDACASISIGRDTARSSPIIHAASVFVDVSDLNIRTPNSRSRTSTATPRRTSKSSRGNANGREDRGDAANFYGKRNSIHEVSMESDGSLRKVTTRELYHLIHHRYVERATTA